MECVRYLRNPKLLSDAACKISSHGKTKQGGAVTVRNSQPVQVDSSAVLRHCYAALRHTSCSKFDLNVWLAEEKHIAELNRCYRGKPKPTDILSFGMLRWKPPGTLQTPMFHALLIGELVLCPSYISREHDLAARLPLLLVHGLTHLQGFDHRTDEQYEEMRAVETRVLTLYRCAQRHVHIDVRTGMLTGTCPARHRRQLPSVEPVAAEGSDDLWTLHLHFSHGTIGHYHTSVTWQVGVTFLRHDNLWMLIVCACRP